MREVVTEHARFVVGLVAQVFVLGLTVVVAAVAVVAAAVVVVVARGETSFCLW